MEKIRSVFEIDKKQEIDLIKVVSCKYFLIIIIYYYFYSHHNFDEKVNGVKQDNGMEVISAKEC